MSFGLSKHIEKKVRKEISSTFSTEEFELIAVKISDTITSKLPSHFSEDTFFKIQTANVFLGYAYVSKAASKTDTFDYLVLLDTDLVIVKSKILVYREDYGAEIRSRRWLKQFIGKNQNDTLKYRDNVVAISGATISAQSMTLAINNLLQSLKIINTTEVLKTKN
jgi:Na+-translocating ferredoxin:NAD+ oxidoreductase RnfG subunit